MPRILRKDVVALAKKYFQLELPTTIDELKTAYRREARRLHPDKNPGDKTAEMLFKKMTRAKDLISATMGAVLNETSSDVPSLVDGTPLSLLGQGIKDGSPCLSCESRGYLTIEADRFINCKWCRGTGATVRCPQCRGTGIYKGNQCSPCEGIGELGLTLARGMYSVHRTCVPCMGRGGFRASRPVYKHVRCNDCGGLGQRLIPEPNWLKKLLAIVRQ
jgi:molecular chaperone DnaJ